MKITQNIKNAINSAVKESGSRQKLADLCGITQRNISKYLSGEVKSIRDDCWDKVYPFIMGYLSDEFNEPFIKKIAINSTCAVGFPLSRLLKGEDWTTASLARSEFSLNITQKIIEAILDDETLDGNTRLHLRKKINELVYKYESELVKKHTSKTPKN